MWDPWLKQADSCCSVLCSLYCSFNFNQDQELLLRLQLHSRLSSEACLGVHLRIFHSLRRQKGKMAKVLDVVYKSVNVALGVATVVFGANLAVNIYRGFSWHYSQKAAEEAQRKEIP